MKRIFARIGCLLIVGLAGCAPSTSIGSPSQTSGASEPPRAPKVITAAALTPIKAFGAWDTSPSGGIFALTNVHSSPLFTTDSAGNVTARLLTRLPSVDEGTISVLPDGRMQTTWNLRPDVKW